MKKSGIPLSECRIFIVAAESSDEDVFQYEENCQYIHCRSQLLEVAAYKVYEHVCDHSDEDAVRDRVRQRHHDYADECRNRL